MDFYRAASCPTSDCALTISGIAWQATRHRGAGTEASPHDLAH